ncbi:SUN domain-containing protein, partial [Tribonema minus]
MAGHEGFLTVQLAAPVTITAVSLEHVPQSVTDDPRSAPRTFRIIGHRLGTSAQQIAADPTHGDVVAEGMYSITAPRARQHYTATSSGPYWAVTLEVLSNHGSPNFTCIYKLGVAGEPV